MTSRVRIASHHVASCRVTDINNIIDSKAMVAATCFCKRRARFRRTYVLCLSHRHRPSSPPSHRPCITPPFRPPFITPSIPPSPHHHAEPGCKFFPFVVVARYCVSSVDVLYDSITTSGCITNRTGKTRCYALCKCVAPLYVHHRW